MAISVATNSAWRETFDRATYALNTIDYAHHEIHSGSSYVASYIQDVTGAGTINVTIKTPDTASWAHMLWHVGTELESELRFYEGSTAAADGGTITPQNRNRNSTKTSACVVMGTPTVGTVGSLLFADHLGGGAASARFGGENRADNEWVLKQNTTYTVQLVNMTGSNNQMSVALDWYEHTDKE
jgi:hypothetical protein